MLLVKVVYLSGMLVVQFKYKIVMLGMQSSHGVSVLLQNAESLGMHILDCSTELSFVNMECSDFGLVCGSFFLVSQMQGIHGLLELSASLFALELHVVNFFTVMSHVIVN